MAVTIPRIVHRIWFGPHEMRAELVEFGKQWETFGYEVRLWTEANLPPLVNQRQYDEIAERNVLTGCAPRDLGKWTQRADLVSYELIDQFGGIYANTDIQPLRDVHEILDDVEAFCAWETQEQVMCNALFGGVAGNVLTKTCIDMLPNLFADQSLQMQQQTGPALITAAANDCGRQAVRVFDQKTFYPYSFGEMDREWDDFPDAYTSHHWGHTRGVNS